MRDQPSFSASVKEEVSRHWPERECCRRTLLGSLLVHLGSHRRTRGTGPSFLVKSEHLALLRLLMRLLRESLPPEAPPEPHPRVLPRPPPRGRGGRRRYTMAIPHLAREHALAGTPAAPRKCCLRMTLRGAFLARGSVNGPGRPYHLELALPTAGAAAELLAVLKRLRLPAKSVTRRGSVAVYVKRADEIADLLSILGAHNARLRFEEDRAVRETKNVVARRVNCETANLRKTVDASATQRRVIEFLADTVGLASLPAPLRETARLRLRYPLASLEELGTRCTPPRSKSAVNHRLRALQRLAEAAIEDRRGAHRDAAGPNPDYAKTSSSRRSQDAYSPRARLTTQTNSAGSNGFDR